MAFAIQRTESKMNEQKWIDPLRNARHHYVHQHMYVMGVPKGEEREKKKIRKNIQVTNDWKHPQFILKC